MRKGDISIQVLIWAAIGIVVLIVLLSIFGSRVRIFGQNVGGTCQDQGGVCANQDGTPNGKCDDPDYPIKILATGCAYYKADGSEDTDRKDVGQCCLSLG